jgi:hypothetical protein
MRRICRWPCLVSPHRTSLLCPHATVYEGDGRACALRSASARTASELTAKYGGHLRVTWQHALNGFAVTMGADAARRMAAVKVLNCAGSGTTAQVVDGINWVTQHAVKPAVANMSLGGSADTAIDSAVTNSISSGITYADACNSSPARVPSAITVNASDSSDAPRSPTSAAAPTSSTPGPSTSNRTPIHRAGHPWRGSPLGAPYTRSTRSATHPHNLWTTTPPVDNSPVVDLPGPQRRSVR